MYLCMTELQLKLRALEATSKTRFQTFGDTFGGARSSHAPSNMPQGPPDLDLSSKIPVKMVPKSILETSWNGFGAS